MLNIPKFYHDMDELHRLVTPLRAQLALSKVRTAVSRGVVITIMAIDKYTIAVEKINKSLNELSRATMKMTGVLNHVDLQQ